MGVGRTDSRHLCRHLSSGRFRAVAELSDAERAAHARRPAESGRTLGIEIYNLLNATAILSYNQTGLSDRGHELDESCSHTEFADPRIAADEHERPYEHERPRVMRDPAHARGAEQ